MHETVSMISTLTICSFLISPFVYMEHFYIALKNLGVAWRFTGMSASVPWVSPSPNFNMFGYYLNPIKTDLLVVFFSVTSYTTKYCSILSTLDLSLVEFRDIAISSHMWTWKLPKSRIVISFFLNQPSTNTVNWACTKIKV